MSAQRVCGSTISDTFRRMPSVVELATRKSLCTDGQTSTESNAAALLLLVTFCRGRYFRYISRCAHQSAGLLPSAAFPQITLGRKQFLLSIEYCVAACPMT